MSLKRGLIIFLLLTMGVSAVVIWSSLDKKALDVISSADWRIVSFALLAVFASWGCDAGRFCLVARSMGYKITFGRGLLLTWLLYFGCAVTPMQVGGGPFQVFVLYKRDGVPVGSGVAITLIRTLLSTFILSIAAPSAILLAPELLHGHKAVVGVFIYVLLLSVVVWTVFIFSVVHPETLRRLIGRFTLWLRRFKRLKRLPVLKIYRRLGQEMDSYSSNIRLMLGAGRRSFFGAVLLSVLQLMAIFPCYRFSSAPWVCRSTTFRPSQLRRCSCSFCTSSPHPAPAAWQKAAGRRSSGCSSLGTLPALRQSSGVL